MDVNDAKHVQDTLIDHPASPDIPHRRPLDPAILRNVSTRKRERERERES
jgi:hypothetical protein